MTDIRDLVSALADAAPDPAVKLRQGVVKSVQTSSLTLTIGGSTTSVSGIKYLSSYTPVVNDTVWLATDGRDWIVIGKLGPSSGGSTIVEAMPAGSIIEWGTNTAPANWLIADGAAVSRTTYASLFAAIGTTFGAGDGSTTFNLPNLKGRVPVGRDATQTEFDVLGETGGAKTHTLTAAEMPSHTHTGSTSTDGAHTHGTSLLRYTDGTGLAGWNTGPPRVYLGSTDSAGSHSHTFTTAAAGSGGAHNNLQPYTVVNYIIKYSNGDTAGDSQLTQRVSALEAQPYVRLDRSTAQSIPDSAYTAISWNSEIADSANMWASGTNITIPSAGVYQVNAHVSWPNSTAGSRTLRVLKNGTNISAEKISPFNGSHWSNVTWAERFSAGDIITADVFQNVGAALSLNDASISVVRLCT